MNAMYISRLALHTLPGQTHRAETELKKLQEMVAAAGAKQSRVLRTHFASLGAPDLVFEQEAQDLAALEDQIQRVTDSQDFRQWTERMSGFLSQSPKREIYLAVHS